MGVANSVGFENFTHNWINMFIDLMDLSSSQ